MKEFDLRKYLKHNPLLKEGRTLTWDEVNDLYDEFPEIDNPSYKGKEVISADSYGENATFKITTPDGMEYEVFSDSMGDDVWKVWGSDDLERIEVDSFDNMFKGTTPDDINFEGKVKVSELKTRIKEIIKSTINEVKKDEHGNHLEPQFKKGDKVTYLGNPGEITKVNKTASGTYTYSVSYNKGTGKTKASDLSNKGSELKKT